MDLLSYGLGLQDEYKGTGVFSFIEFQREKKEQKNETFATPAQLKKQEEIAEKKKKQNAKQGQS
jgi:hypothetical protein